MTVQIKVKANNTLPFRATMGSAGYDIFANADMLIPPMSRRLIPTGLYMEIPYGYEAQIRSRSGLAANHGVIVLNAPGTIDSDYRGEIKVVLFNTGPQEFQVTRGMRIAQLVFAQVVDTAMVPAVDLSTTSRTGGFGSTGLD